MKSLLISILLILGASVSPGSEGDVAQVGLPAPTIVCTPVNGLPLELERLRGKAVLLVFFSLQSEPSMRELSFVEREICQPGCPEGLVMIAIGRDQEEKSLAALIHDHPLFQFGADPKRHIYTLYATQGVPRTYVVGKDGRIKYASLGFDEFEIDRIKDAVLAGLK